MERCFSYIIRWKQQYNVYRCRVWSYSCPCVYDFSLRILYLLHLPFYLFCSFSFQLVFILWLSAHVLWKTSLLPSYWGCQIISQYFLSVSCSSLHFQGFVPSPCPFPYLVAFFHGHHFSSPFTYLDWMKQCHQLGPTLSAWEIIASFS